MIERLAGTGKVHKDSDFLANVLYTIISEQTGGIKNITGSLRVIEGEKDLMKYEELALHLEQGRKATILMSGGNLATGEFTFHVNTLT